MKRDFSLQLALSSFPWCVEWIEQTTLHPSIVFVPFINTPHLEYRECGKREGNRHNGKGMHALFLIPFMLFPGLV